MHNNNHNYNNSYNRGKRGRGGYRGGYHHGSYNTSRYSQNNNYYNNNNNQNKYDNNYSSTTNPSNAFNQQFTNLEQEAFSEEPKDQYYNDYSRRKDNYDKRNRNNKYNKREYKQEKHFKESTTQQQQEESKPKPKIEPGYYTEAECLKEKLLDIELKQEAEQNAESINELREDVKQAINQDYDKQLQNITTITKQGPSLNEKNILYNILNNNDLIKSNPFLACSIIESFKSTQTQDELQSYFFDLLGIEQMTLIGNLIQNEKEIRELINVALAAIKTSDTLTEKQENLILYGNDTSSLEVINRRKKQRRNKKKSELENIQEENIEILHQLGFDYNFNTDDIGDTEQYNAIAPITKVINETPFFKDRHSNIQKTTYDTEFIKAPTYVIYKVTPLLKERKRITPVNKVTALPEWSHRIFDFNFFNEIQSTVFDKAFNTDENLLISAPTGAGKTNIALLTILREIEIELKHKGYTQVTSKFSFSKFTWDFKIIYLVPLKALANEIVNKFNTSLKFLNIKVNEFSGDVNLSQDEIQRTNVFIGIPEKWDLFTRKNKDIFTSLKLMIIDEVHLLNEDRGRVLECIVARTIKRMEYLQKFIRFCGLSATLPNYSDVADFLRVKEGSFAFDDSYRATPLTMKFFGLRENCTIEEYKRNEADVAYEQVVKYLQKDKQVLVFVHSRMETVNFARELFRIAEQRGETSLFLGKNRNNINKKDLLKNTTNKVLNELIPYGIGFHNAGVLRKDRTLVESLFANKVINVLVSTSTLAWGVNLPAYAVIIKGTMFYDANQGKKVDMGILDIQQMFGRAGRPQFDSKGVGLIITPMKKVQHFVSLLKNQISITSTLDKFLPDVLNAEIAIGTICNVKDAFNWIKLTYYAVRSENNKGDFNAIKEKIKYSLKELHDNKLIRYVSDTGNVHPTELGRIACNYYMNYKTVAMFNEELKDYFYYDDILKWFAKSDEFSNLKVYEEEKTELESIARKLKILTDNSIKNVEVDDVPKPLILLQSYLSGWKEYRNSSLHMDCLYIVDNAPRIFRAMVEISLHKHLVVTTSNCLNYMKFIERRMLPSHNVLYQFTYDSFKAKTNKIKTSVRNQGYIRSEICNGLQNKGYDTVEKILSADIKELSFDLHLQKDSILDLFKFARTIPHFKIDLIAKPITRTILNITMTLTPNFKWSKRWNLLSEPFWIIVDNRSEIIHYEYFIFTPKQKDEHHKDIMRDIVFTFAVPFAIEPGQKQARTDMIYNVNIFSDRWVGCGFKESIQLSDIEVPSDEDVTTELLDLYPLPLSALNNEIYENIFSTNFMYFNPIQTQIFYSCYNTDVNLLVGAPTGSGKTVIAELAMLREFNQPCPGKIIYIAPLKSLAKERVSDWKEKFTLLNKNVLELTGDFTPDVEQLLKADILITTPEKWDGISRNWQHRTYVQKVAVVIIDEIHLLGLDRGPIIEVIVSRMRFISAKTKSKIRFIGLSTALANSVDVAEWLGISTTSNSKQAPGLFNFKPAVRPCPVTVHIEGFHEKHYCPRMATMNVPCHNAIMTFSKSKPVLIFVSSRRQTRLTALDLISLNANNDYTECTFLKASRNEINKYIECVIDDNLKHTLNFGIGMHHAGLIESDRKIVEELFHTQKIQILIATSTLAWGVNFPAHLVIIKGTEYYHPKLFTYVDMPITDILQMIGRAGRPQYDDEAVACLFVKQDKKNFYKKFLYEPFPLESSLHQMLYDHINAEIASETLTTKHMCIEYIKWTYFFKRLVKNPTYYGLATSTNAAVLNDYLTNLINNVLTTLNESGCIKIHDNGDIESTSIGNLASFYYISHKTAKVFSTLIKPNLTIYDLIPIISCAEEFADLPVRHNEDLMNKELHKNLPYQYENINYGGSHDKTNLLFQAHFSRISMPISDYDTDLKLVLDNSIRILLFMADIAYQKKILDTTLKILTMIQMVMQGLWHDDSSLYSLPYLDESDVCNIMNKGNVSSLCELCEKANNKEDIEMFLKKKCELTRLKSDEANQICELLKKYPLLEVKFKVFAGNAKTMERIYDRPINANEDCHIRINITRRNYDANDSKGNLVIHAKYPKIKSCRWFIVIGNERTNEILAFEKVSFKEKVTKNIVFTTPCVIDDNSLQVYIISDSYFGIDQQYSIRLQSINNMIIRKCGLVEIKEIEKDIKDKEDKDDYEDDDSDDDDDVETQNEENEALLYIP